MVMLHIKLNGIRMQQHGTNISPVGVGSQVNILLFLEYGHVAYQIKWKHKCSNMVANILPQTPPTPHDTAGQNIKIQLFSEHGHVAYQIKGKDKCSYMVANILPADPPSHHDPWVQKVKIQLVLKMVM